MKMSTTTILLLIVIAIVGVVAYTSYSGNDDAMMKDTSQEGTVMQDAGAEGTMMAGEETMEKDDAMMADDKMGAEDAMMEKEADMTIDMMMFAFAPNMIEIPAGETMTIKLTNSGGFHDLVIDELNVASEQIGEGDETMVTITAPADTKGESYEFYCSVGDHRAKGMVGTIKVI